MTTKRELIAEFGTAQIPLVDMCEKYLGLGPDRARRAAAKQELPLPVFQCGGKKSPWLVSADRLAKFLDAKEKIASSEWEALNT